MHSDNSTVSKTPAQVLASAFQEDPYTCYLDPDPVSRVGKLEWLMGTWIRACRANGVVDVIPGKGVAAWMAPGKHGFGPLTSLRSGLFLAPWKLGRAETKRMLAIEDDLGQLPKSTKPNDSWYLLALGVDPSTKGQGLSRRLLDKGFARADADGLPVRLETNNEANVSLYKHLGFDLVGHRDTPGLIPQWSFLRPAA